MMNYYVVHGLYGMFWLMVVLRILVFAGVVYLIYRLVRKSDFRSRAESDRALALLRERFAKGEITEEEYTRLKNILTEDKK